MEVATVLEQVVWVDASECLPREALGILQYSLIGKRKTKPRSPHAVKEVIRGVNSSDKRDVIRNFVRSQMVDLVCL